jgi:hypothetical protein
MRASGQNFGRQSRLHRLSLILFRAALKPSQMISTKQHLGRVEVAETSEADIAKMKEKLRRSVCL